jgi:hypothetical protein
LLSPADPGELPPLLKAVPPEPAATDAAPANVPPLPGEPPLEAAVLPPPPVAAEPAGSSDPHANAFAADTNKMTEAPRMTPRRL